MDAAWGHVGLGPKSRVTANDTVFAGYRHSQLRLDTVQVTADGKATLKAGQPHISAPVPPEADAGCVAIAHVFVNYRDTEVKRDQIYPILETAVQAATASTPGRIPKTLAKLKAGQPVKVICWGDSVTVGGDVSKPELRYADVFVAGLRERFPRAQITLQNISVGGSHSRQWLYPDKVRFHDKPWQETGVTFQRVVDAKPDLVTLEFVNDAGLPPAVFD